MKKIELAKNVYILLPQSLGDNIKWYGFRASYQDMAAMSADGSDCQFFAPNKYRIILATGCVGFDALPSLRMGEASYLAGTIARETAGYYLLRELHLTDEEIFDLSEQLGGYTINVDISPRPMDRKAGKPVGRRAL